MKMNPETASERRDVALGLGYIGNRSVDCRCVREPWTTTNVVEVGNDAMPSGTNGQNERAHKLRTKVRGASETAI